MAGKEAIVIILDVGESMSKLDTGTAETSLDKAKTAVRLMVQQKLLFTKQDEIGLVLFNSNNTNNSLAEEDPGSYEHIEVGWAIQKPNLDFLEAIESVNVQRGKADLFDAILVASGALDVRVGKKKFLKRILLITDAAEPLADLDQLDQIAAGMNDLDVRLNVIGIGFKDDDDEDDEEEEKENEIKEEDDEKMPEVDEDDSRTPRQRKNEKIIKKFCDKLKIGSVFAARSAIDSMAELRSKAVINRPNKEQFHFSDDLQIPVHIYAHTKEQRMPSLTKESLVGDETKKVGMERTYVNKHGDEQHIVDKDDRIKCYKYGKEKVPMDDEVEAQVKWSETKSLKLLAFIPREKVPRHLFMSTAECIVPPDGDEGAQVAISALVQACHETNTAGLVRLVKTNRSSPIVGVITPRIKSSMSCFIFNQIPYSNDIREFPFQGFHGVKEYKPTREQIGACRNLINSLDLMNMKDDDGDSFEALQPKKVFNPVLQRVYQNMEIRALDPTAEIQDLDPRISIYINPNKELFESATPAFEKFSQNFTFKVNEKKIKKGIKRKRGDDLLDFMAQFSENSSNKKAKTEEEDDEDFDLELGGLGESLFGGEKVTKIGTQNPIKDFDELLKARSHSDLFDRLHDELWKVIHQLVNDAHQGDTFNKVVDCMNHLRFHSVQEEEGKRFNKEIKEFKNKYENSEKSLWEKVVEKKITLIHKDDFGEEEGMVDIDVTKVEADAFLIQPQVSEPQSVPSAKDDESDDDAMFDDLL